MMQYLGITIRAESGRIEICCASASDARQLADELSAYFKLRDADAKPTVDDYRIIYSGNLWLLKEYLLHQRWKLTMDTRTRLIFDRAPVSGEVNLGNPN